MHDSTAPRAERRGAARRTADFYAIERRGASRYFRLVRNVSSTGLLFENRMADEHPGQIIELELPRRASPEPVQVRAEVVYVTPSGQVGVRLLDFAEPLESLGGALPL